MPENENAGRQAADQAEAYNSVFSPTPLKLDDGTVIKVPPHPNMRMFDDEAQAALERLEFELESYDRHPDIYIPEQTVKDKSGNEMKLPAETKPGPLKLPHRKTTGETSELLDPPYTVQVAKIALGDDYEKLRAGTIDGRKGSAANVWRIWNQQGLDIAERQAADSKSDGGTGVSADVAATDSE
jgi:hypothetical protein